MPNGRSIVLERQQGSDAGGYSGLEDEVDNHWDELFKAALLSAVLGVGAELGSGADSGNNTTILHALRLGAANSLNQTGQQVVRRNLNIQPTLTIRPGFPVRVNELFLLWRAMDDPKGPRRRQQRSKSKSGARAG
jgi:type IV secretory pathway VirB10-like protein